MSTLSIHKLESGAFIHNDSIDGDFFLGRFSFKEENNKAFLVEAYGAKKRQYDVYSISVYDFGGIEETFTNFIDLINRLVELGYSGIDVGEINNFLSNQLSDYTDATTPLDGTELALVNQGGTWKKVEVSEFGGGGGDFIPRAGTAVGFPVTGDIEVADFTRIKCTSTTEGVISYIEFDDGSFNFKRENPITGFNSSFRLTESGIFISDDNPSNIGLRGVQDFTSNIEDLDYTQKKYVGYRGEDTLNSGTVTILTDKVKPTSKIFVSVNNPSGTQGFLCAPQTAIVDGVSFDVNSTSSSENSTIYWWLVD